MHTHTHSVVAARWRGPETVGSASSGHTPATSDCHDAVIASAIPEGSTAGTPQPGNGSRTDAAVSATSRKQPHSKSMKRAPAPVSRQFSGETSEGLKAR